MSDIIRNFLDKIDEKYYECKRKRLSRFSLEWGYWSRQLNLTLRENIEKDNADTPYYQYLFIYWLNRSQLLELHFKSKIGHMGKKSTLEKEGNELRRTIKTGSGFQPIDKEKIMKRIMNV